MPYTKITEQDLVNKGVTGLPDTPNLSTSEMQQKFDELAKEVIVPKFNNLVDELDNSNIDKKVESETITNMKLNEDNNIEVSTDGGTTYKQTSSSGHIIMDGTGRSFPQRSRLQYSANVQITDIQSDNTTFLTVPSGVKGDKGDSATIQIGNVASSPIPYVTNVGSQYDAIFDFGIPQGQDGQAATIQVGTVTSGANASVSNRGTSASAIFDFVLPKGEKGDSGTSFQVLGMYSTYADLIAAHPTGNRGDAYAVGNSTTNVVYNWNNDTQTWDNLGALKGAKGDDGQAATVTVGTVTTGQTSSVINSGTTENAILDFTLEKGDKGDKGDAATIAVGTVTRGENATVTNVGTTTNAVFDFTIPKGDKGDPGEPSIVNGKSGESIVLYGYDMFLKNYTKASQYSDITDDDSIQSAIGKLESRNSGGSKIIVTTDEESIGNTFTLSNGVKTLSQIATSSLVMEFFVDDIGTWTVTNVEAENSTTVTIEYYSVYNVVLGVGNIGITVNYDAEYVGHTFTITNGTKTQTKTATSSLSVSFVCADLGTWVVSNSYDSVTKSINVTEEGQYSVTFTISHGMDIQEWLSKGGVSGTYATLSDILADEKAIRQLMTKHDSVDYLVANASDTDNLTTILNNDISAKWINLRDYALDTLYATFKSIMDTADKYFYGEWVASNSVPTMTSNTLPSGVVSASSIERTDFDAYKCFDGNSTTYWSATKNTTLPAYLQYQFPSATKINGLGLMTNDSRCIDANLTLKGSNDGSVWNNITDLVLDSSLNGQKQYVSFANNTSYTYYRLEFNSHNLVAGSDKYCQLFELELLSYGAKGNVPIMTSNNAPYGTVARSGIYQSFDGYLAFDGNDSTNFTSSNSMPAYLSYTFTNPVCVKKVYMKVHYTYLKDYKIQASNDGFVSDIHDLYTGQNANTENNEIELDIENDSYYLAYRVYATSSWSASYLSLYTLQFYGRELSVSVPKMESNTTPWGEAIGSGNLGDEYNIFDKSYTNNMSGTSRAGDTEMWLGYDFKTPIKLGVIKYALQPYSSWTFISNNVCKLQGSNGGAWEDILDNIVFDSWSTKAYTKVIDTDKTYSKYRIYTTTGNFRTSTGAIALCLLQLELFGLDYSEHTERHYIYDNGVEVEELTTYVSGSNCVAEKKVNELLVSCPATSSVIAEVYTNNPINLSGYSLVRGIGGDMFDTTNEMYGNIHVTSDVPMHSNGDTNLGYNVVRPYMLPNGLYYDISSSSFTGSNYLMVVASNNSGAVLKKATYKSWWLE